MQYFLVLLALVAAISAYQLPRASLSTVPKTMQQKDEAFLSAIRRQKGLEPPRQHRFGHFKGTYNDSLVFAKGGWRSFVAKTAKSIPRVPMLNYEDEVWVADIQMGTPSQGPYRVVMDSGSSNLWIPSAECDLKFDTGCQNKNKYDNSKSSTYAPDRCEVLFIPYGTGFVIGFISNDTLSVGGVQVKNTAFGEIVWMADFFATTPIDGILGLAFPDISSDKVPPVLDRMYEEKLIPKFEFSTFLAQKVSSKTSEVIFGGVDEKHYTGDFVYADVLLPSYWLVGAEKIYLNGNAVHDCALDYCPCVVDTGTSIIIGPPYVWDKVIKQIGNVSVDCSNVKDLPTLSVSLGGITGGQELPLTPQDYVVFQETSNGTQCFLGIESSLEVTPLTILGDPFLRAYYTVFDRTNKRVGFAKAVQ